MKILVLGATGRLGKLLVDEAIGKGYDVNVLVRDATAANLKPSDQLKIFVGLPTDPYALETAMLGCEAVINALNVSRNNDFPWSKLRTPADLLSATMGHIIILCNKLGIKRVVTVSAWGVGDSKSEIPFWFRWLIDHSNIKYPYIDHERQEDLLKATNLYYTIVRPVALTNSSNFKAVIVSVNNQPKALLTISRGSVARFIIAELEKGYIGQIITISNSTQPTLIPLLPNLC